MVRRGQPCPAGTLRSVRVGEGTPGRGGRAPVPPAANFAGTALEPPATPRSRSWAPTPSARSRAAPTPGPAATAFRPSAHEARPADVSSASFPDPSGDRDRGRGAGPAPWPGCRRPISAPCKRGAVVSPAPAPPPATNRAARFPAGHRDRGRTRMQSAMFLAVHHDCGSMDKSAGSGPKSEEKREKMKRTL